MLPYGAWPGSEPGGLRDVWVDEPTWTAYGFNPPEYLPSFEIADPDASAKPTYADLIALSGPAQLAKTREDRLNTLRTECRRRITAAFGASDALDELFIREAGEATAEQHAERLRLLARHRALRSPLAAMTLAQLEAFEPHR